MIKFNSLINAIHDAILSANDALVEQNLEILENFFEATDGRDESQETSQKRLDEALAALNDALSQKGTVVGKRKLRTVLEAIKKASETLSQEDASGARPARARLSSKLMPKMVTLQYPEKTADGVVMSDVKVPLITLAPLSMTQISEVKFRTDLEIQVEGEELLVGFPPPQSATAEGQEDEPRTSPRPTATLEITLTPHQGTEGLRKIVEGYEKMLRSQIP